MCICDCTPMYTYFVCVCVVAYRHRTHYNAMMPHTHINMRIIYNIRNIQKWWRLRGETPCVSCGGVSYGVFDVFFSVSRTRSQSLFTMCSNPAVGTLLPLLCFPVSSPQPPHPLNPNRLRLRRQEEGVCGRACIHLGYNFIAGISHSERSSDDARRRQCKDHFSRVCTLVCGVFAIHVNMAKAHQTSPRFPILQTPPIHPKMPHQTKQLEKRLCYAPPTKSTRHSAARVRLLRAKTQCIELYNVCTYAAAALSLRYVMMMMVMGLADGFWDLAQGSRVPVFRRKLFGMLAWLRADEKERKRRGRGDDNDTGKVVCLGVLGQIA